MKKAFLVALAAFALLTSTASAQSAYEAEIYDACDPSDGDGYHCDASQLIRVMYCESGGDTYAVGPNGERGLFQYHPQSHNPAAYATGFDPYASIWNAAADFAAGGAGYWVCQ